jgi:hypothetical protein
MSLFTDAGGAKPALGAIEDGLRTSRILPGDAAS